MALYLNDNIKIDVKQIEKWLKEESVIKVGSIDSYLIKCVEKDDVELIADLIDHGEKTLEVAIPALTEYTKSSGSEKTLNVLLKNPSESDWKAILMLVKNLDNLLLKNIKKELLIKTKNKINLKTENQILTYKSRVEPREKFQRPLPPKTDKQNIIYKQSLYLPQIF